MEEHMLDGIDQAERYQSYAIVEVMGHKRFHCLIQERYIAGIGFLELTIPLPGGYSHPAIQQPSSIFALHPIDGTDIRAQEEADNEHVLAVANLLTPDERARYEARVQRERAERLARSMQPRPVFGLVEEDEEDEEDEEEDEYSSERERF